MRLFAAVALAALLGACSTATPASNVYDESFAELRLAVQALPESPQRTRVELLVDDLRRDVAAGGSSLKLSADLEELDTLRKLADAITPRGIELGFATGYKDWTDDGLPDGLEICITPRDAVGNAVKCPGEIAVLLRAPSSFGIAGKEIASWQVPAAVVAKSWNDKLFPCYALRLPWEGAPPEAGSATLIVNFHPLHGDMLPAKLDINSENAP